MDPAGYLSRSLIILLQMRGHDPLKEVGASSSLPHNLEIGCDA
jgi:hypothetical protein